jgi:hypothetical protein
MKDEISSLRIHRTNYKPKMSERFSSPAGSFDLICIGLWGMARKVGGEKETIPKSDNFCQNKEEQIVYSSRF